MSDGSNSGDVSPQVTHNQPGMASVAMSLKCEQFWRSRAMDRRALYSQHKKMSLCRSFSTGTDVLDKTPRKCYTRNMSVLETSADSGTYENILDRYSRLENHMPIQEVQERENDKTTETSDLSPDEKSSLARRRWRLYFNVLKLAPPVNDEVTVGNIPGLDEKTTNMKPSTPKSKRRFVSKL